MERIEVESSNIKAIWYNKDISILEIEFTNNSVYQYLEVPEDEYIGIMNADSHWKYLNSNIKPFYKYKQII